MKGIIFIGGGGHCRSVIAAALRSGYEIAGILDMPEKVGSLVSGIKVIGSDDDVDKYADENKFVVTIGAIRDFTSRHRAISRIRESNGSFATIVSSQAFKADSAEIGSGSVVLNNAVINAEAKVGENVIVNTGAIVEHDSIIGDETHISTGAIVNGGCRIGARCFIGSGAIVVNGVSICNDVIVGAGAVVAKDISVPGVYVGVPARKIK